MESYTEFANLYDLFMEDIPYDMWCDYIVDLLLAEKIDGGIVLELGCGTGNITQLLAKKGYDMIGVDNSPNMLNIAKKKADSNNLNILYLLQDMTEFELYGTVRAIVSICDSINYITELEDLHRVFKLANNYLNPGGVFIFDLKTQYYFKDIVGDVTFGDNRENSSFIWENYYYEEECINEYNLTLFEREEKKDGLENSNLYRKYEETHYQRAYTLDEIREAIEKSGMKFVAAYDAFTRKPVRADSERIYIIAREHGK